MNDRELLTLIRDTNPYPEDASQLVVEAVQERVAARLGDGDQSTPARQPVGTARIRSRFGLLAAAIAFVTVMLLVGVVRLLVPPTPDVVAPLPPFDTPQQAAEARAMTFASRDFETYLQLWAPGGWDRGLSRAQVSPEKLEERFVAGAGTNEVVEGPTCEPLSELTWECTMVSRHWELGIISDDNLVEAEHTVTIDTAGRLTSVSRPESQLSQSQRAELAAMDAWLDRNYPTLQDNYRQIFLFLEPFAGSAADFRIEYEAALREYAATLGR